MALSKQQWLYNQSTEFSTSKNKKILVETIKLNDVDDPEVYVAEPIYNWQQTEKGKWVMEHSDPVPSWHLREDALVYGWLCYIVAYLDEKDCTYFRLKYE